MEERIEYLWQKAQSLRARADALDVERWELEDQWELRSDRPVPFTTGLAHRAMQKRRWARTTEEQLWYPTRIWNNQEDR